ncbi:MULTISPECIES: hypothetical protein [Micromonospora]|nr:MULTISPECIES: hypothetical protein [Micromonospora]NES17209.1 hypothetical protein [Micromonospora sp. PPF5-17B]NES39744.1 hypothetical protein [Micromonospora solifontis]NES59008.1 hypothetical protein [Micromonospora sp. PPF5-6]
MFTDTNEPLGRMSTLLVVFAGVHLLLTIFMILKRVRAMFRSFRVRREDPVPQPGCQATRTIQASWSCQLF